MSKGWIGVDLDGTLAEYDGWKGAKHIGKPVPLMLERVKKWWREGKDVKIFTARMSAEPEERGEFIMALHYWCKYWGLPNLEATCEKDFAMIELWDDRAVQVIPNTGRRADGKDEKLD